MRTMTMRMREERYDATYVSTSRGSAMNRVTKNGIMAKTSTMFIPSWIMITMIKTP